MNTSGLIMEESSGSEFHDLNLASRKAEEAAIRRFQAAEWLESMVGPLGILSQPSEREFISCLRNGLVLCNAINKIHPGAVPKVVENNLHVQSLVREFQPPPAYQYFENVRNFLVAVEELRLPAFEASDLERDTWEAGSVGKVVDCILGLKSYHELKQTNTGKSYRNVRSPMVLHSASRTNLLRGTDSCRRLNMSAVCDKQPVEDAIVKVLLDHMIDTKENINDNLLVSLRKRNPDSVKLIKKIISNFMNENLLSDFPDCQKASLMKGACNHKRLLQVQERELLDLKELLSTTKREFQDLQCQLQRFWGEIGNQVQEMSTAALGYHKVLKENRKLYNMVQDLKGSIRVYCRVRPTFTAERKNVVDFIGEDGSIVIFDPSKPQKDGRKVFQFNRVFGPTSTQEEVFLDIQPLIRSVMDGYNVCIFAYGQTGSGKTYTMSGPSDGSTNHTGINYQALEDLFLISKEREDIIKYIIHVQMVEIYNEQVRDLLAEDSSTTRLEIRSCTSESGMNLPDATMHSVNSTVDVLNLMKLGEVNRVVSSTAINSRSSRSHSILTVHVHGKDASGGIQRSCLHLVDLAGSERVDKSKVTGDRLKEAQYINKSLSCLGDVITALSQKNSHIPYRNSKLTLLLQEALGGHAKTLMFAHLSPEEDSFGETISTLKFAQRVSTVELGAARVNKESNEVIQLKEQVESLKKALANKEQNVLYSKTKEIRSPRDKTISMNERTPPHVRRLSIENGSAAKSLKVINPEDRRALRTPIVTRTRRLSLEGQRSAATKDNIHTKKSEDESKSTSPGIGSIKKPFGHFSNGSFTMDVYHLQVPRSPTSSCRKRTVKKDGRTQIPHLQLPKSPEPKVVARNQVQIVMQSEFSVPDESRTTNGYGIRKSLRNIGKLINGSEKRNQKNSVEAQTPIKDANNINEVTSPVTANARSLRRQSLTSIQASAPNRCRRSSLGDKPVDSSKQRQY